jgi:hypothetical protein
VLLNGVLVGLVACGPILALLVRTDRSSAPIIAARDGYIASRCGRPARSLRAPRPSDHNESEVLVIYLFAVLGVSLFGANDPVGFGGVGVAMLTLFRCATLAEYSDACVRGAVTVARTPPRQRATTRQVSTSISAARAASSLSCVCASARRRPLVGARRVCVCVLRLRAARPTAHHREAEREHPPPAPPRARSDRARPPLSPPPSLLLLCLFVFVVARYNVNYWGCYDFNAGVYHPPRAFNSTRTGGGDAHGGGEPHEDEVEPDDENSVCAGIE